MFRDAQSDESPESCRFEIGYIYAKIEGLGNQLMECLVKESQGAITFATTKNSNEVMLHLLPKFGFSKLGESYKSRSGEYYLSLYGNK